MSEYIEREALKRAFQDIDAGRSDGWTTSLSPEEAADYLAEYLDDIPAADVAPVKHGHWNVGYFHDRVCSCCTHPDNDLNVFPHKYCPNCGAKMDGGENS